uniref:Uncharacterized protein n=1 Tax=Gossypium raimondii TaxID=29730 RepID=A0A0D2T9U8_GOSRA|nr:hypothetical protein B456_009G3013002 [Gossypium raimondii]
MSERVRQKCSHSEEKYQTNISLATLDSGCLNSATVCGVDWTTLPDDTSHSPCDARISRDLNFLQQAQQMQ